MQGVTLLVGLVLLGSLAVPAGLLASQESADPVAGEIAPAAPDSAPDAAADSAPDAVANSAPDAAPDSASDSAPDSAENAEGEPARDTREPDARAAATRTVLMEDIEFKPRRIQIDPGDTVRWENRDEAKHDAIGEDGSFETPIIDRGETSSHTFGSKGKFPYFCSIHEGMTGTIQVGASSSGGGGGGGGGGSSDGTRSGGGGAIGGDTPGSSSGTGSAGSFGSSGSNGGISSLASTGSELLWLGLIGYGLVAVGAFARLAAIGR